MFTVEGFTEYYTERILHQLSIEKNMEHRFTHFLAVYLKSTMENDD